jgi:hypothetical protein
MQLYYKGDKYLITTDDWFYGPDGKQYKAVWGTFQGIYKDEELGIKTNRHSTNWYIKIGDVFTVTIAGCQIHYAIKCEHCNTSTYEEEIIHEGKVHRRNCFPRVFNADDIQDTKELSKTVAHHPV